MSLLCSGVSPTPSLAWHVVIYNDGEYIPVIKCIGYKQNHGADPDLLPLYDRRRPATGAADRARPGRLPVGSLLSLVINDYRCARPPSAALPLARQTKLGGVGYLAVAVTAAVHTVFK
jgi:hypothetical protein